MEFPLDLGNFDVATYFVWGGSGDVFNALVHSEKILRNSTFDLVIRDDHLELVGTIVGNFQTKPRMVYTVPQDKHATIQEALYADPANFYRGPIMRHDPPGIRHLWADPGDWDHCNPLAHGDIDCWRHYFKSLVVQNSLPPMSIIFFPNAVSHPNKTFEIENLATWILNQGHHTGGLFVNVRPNESFEAYLKVGLTPLYMGHKDLLSNVYTLGSRVMLVGTRSGVFDLIRYSDSFAYIGMELEWAKNTPTWRMMYLENRLYLQEELICSAENIGDQAEKFGSFYSAFLMLDRIGERFKNL
jgi:hypothetical protein